MKAPVTALTTPTTPQAVADRISTLMATIAELMHGCSVVGLSDVAKKLQYYRDELNYIRHQVLDLGPPHPPVV